jgi:hypothetical protein
MHVPRQPWGLSLNKRGGISAIAAYDELVWKGEIVFRVGFGVTSFDEAC